ncbi:MAG TPA: hypothetical protein VGD67_02050 [Pseudonocardiaceae bacterium]
MSIDLDGLRDYADLCAALRRVRLDAGRSYADLEAATAGRVSRHAAAAILDGVLPATGEQFVLLLRALGRRAEVQRWVEAWFRLDGPRLGGHATSWPIDPPHLTAARGQPLPVALLVFVVVTAVVLLVLM